MAATKTKKAKKAGRTASRAGIYAGSFDPPTVGHLWMIEHAARLFDELIVALGVNPEKRSTFTIDERLEMLRLCAARFENVRVATYTNQYLIHYARQQKAAFIVRGIRSESDYEYERAMRNINGDLDPAVTTVFLMPPRNIAEVSSSLVKGMIGPEGWQDMVRPYVPSQVYRQLRLKFHAATSPGKGKMA
jgi:pantetheine-phosphate adenylyltransferase